MSVPHHRAVSCLGTIGETDAEIQSKNFALAETWLAQAGERGATIACLGETFNVWRHAHAREGPRSCARRWTRRSRGSAHRAPPSPGHHRPVLA